ncbi:hypothetical protein E3C22_18100 [Jiella endophytica]|uniref:DNA primase n=1 Tax=Jiella endophytica TaxID=2558362 RepID=A0A4Y8RFL7_9HYPH|nr:hypothetical protein E3C22_18100 [Jiella endophytica]
MEEARQVSVGEAADRLGVAGLKRVSTGEEAGPCSVCGGTDRFSINRGRNAWNCRGADGGHDGISLAAHLSGLDVSQREGFLAACAAALGRDAPGDEAESAEERAQREARLAKRRREAEAKRAEAERMQNVYREKEIAKARGKWAHAAPIAGRAGAPVIAYLTARLGGFAPPALPFARVIADENYWLQPQKGKAMAVCVSADRPGPDAVWRPVCGRGEVEAIFSSPAMVLPFVMPDGAIVGCHLTWIARAGMASHKGRPSVWLREEALDGPDAGSVTIARLPMKKMRGVKKGGLLPLVGSVAIDGRILPDPARTRFVCGEGSENVLAVAIAEGGATDTIYVAAGDLGNLAGRAAARFPHPTLKNKGGKAPLQVAGPIPKPDEPADASAQVPDHVTEVLLVADGDSELIATGAAMMRAEARLSRPDRSMVTAWPPAGMDFCDLLSAREEAA